MSVSNTVWKNRAHKALRDRFPLETNPHGYVPAIEANLLHGITLSDFAAELGVAGGNELKKKFHAIHSSSALAVNTFGLFKDHPEDLVILGESGFEKPVFEKKLWAGFQGNPPTLDVFLTRGDECWAVESKFTEYFSPKRAKYAPVHLKRASERLDEHWMRAMQESLDAGMRHLDVAQLVKHAFGISRLLEQGDIHTKRKPIKATLIYLYWEPANAEECEPCVRHREEIAVLGREVAGGRIAFKPVGYDEIWQEWRCHPVLAPHVQQLLERYIVAI